MDCLEGLSSAARAPSNSLSEPRCGFLESRSVRIAPQQTIGDCGSPHYQHVASKRTDGNPVTTLARLLAVTDLLELLVIPLKPDSREITQVIDRGPTTELIFRDIGDAADDGCRISGRRPGYHVQLRAAAFRP
jgi:hypothetical protein